MSGYTPIQPDSIEPDTPIVAQVNETPSTTTVQPNYGTTKPASGSLYQMNFYSRFFDINTEDFFGKIVLALNPFNHASVARGQSDEGPTELYGFIWINATLVFLMFVSATGSNLLAQWLHASEAAPKYEYNFQLLTLSISIFYGYTVFIPLALYVVTTWVLKYSHRLSLSRLISIYSYANVLWIPTTAANVILAVFVSNAKHHAILNIAQWILVAVSASLSALSIVLKVRPIIVKNSVLESGQVGGVDGGEAVGQNKHQLVLFALLAAHLAFAVVIKFSFFGIA